MGRILDTIGFVIKTGDTIFGTSETQFQASAFSRGQDKRAGAYLLVLPDGSVGSRETLDRVSARGWGGSRPKGLTWGGCRTRRGAAVGQLSASPPVAWAGVAWPWGFDARGARAALPKAGLGCAAGREGGQLLTHLLVLPDVKAVRRETHVRVSARGWGGSRPNLGVLPDVEGGSCGPVVCVAPRGLGRCSLALGL